MSFDQPGKIQLRITRSSGGPNSNVPETVGRLFLRTQQGASVVHGGSIRDNRCKKFRLVISKNFFTLKTGQHWNRLLREVVQSPALEIFQA